MVNDSDHNKYACNAFVQCDNLHNFLAIKLIVSTAKKLNWIIVHDFGEAKSSYVLTAYILNSPRSNIFVYLSVFQVSDVTYVSVSKYRM